MVTNDKQYMRDYYQRNKHRFQCKYSSTIYCEDCDTSVVKAYWHRHIKTKKHNMNVNKDLMNNTCNDEDQLGNEDIAYQIIALRAEVKQKLDLIHRLEHSMK